MKKTNPKVGCLIMLIFVFAFFGIPLIVMSLGIPSDGIVAQTVFVLIFLAINIGIYKLRGSQKVEDKNFYELRPEKQSVNITKEEKPTLNFCPQCGEKLEDSIKFCTSCGSKL